MVISADSQAETGTENSKRLDCRSMFPLCTCLHQNEHKCPVASHQTQIMQINAEKN